MSYTCHDGGPHRVGGNNKCVDCGRTNAEIDRLRERDEELDFEERMTKTLATLGEQIAAIGRRVDEGIAAIEDRLIRMEKRQRGVCPSCGVHNPKRAVLAPADSTYKAWAKAQREAGFDPESGHRLTCTEAT